MPQPCDCPTDYCEYDEDEVDVVAGGKTIDKALEHAKTKAEKTARREAEEAMAAAERSGKACKEPCEAWFQIRIGTPDAQEYPFHSDKRQFAIGWCEWTLLVKCVLPEQSAKTPAKKGTGKKKKY